MAVIADFLGAHRRPSKDELKREHTGHLHLSLQFTFMGSVYQGDIQAPHDRNWVESNGAA